MRKGCDCDRTNLLSVTFKYRPLRFLHYQRTVVGNSCFSVASHCHCSWTLLKASTSFFLKGRWWVTSYSDFLKTIWIWGFQGECAKFQTWNLRKPVDVHQLENMSWPIPLAYKFESPEKLFNKTGYYLVHLSRKRIEIQIIFFNNSQNSKSFASSPSP